MLINIDKLIPKFEIKYNYNAVNGYLRQFRMSKFYLICFQRARATEQSTARGLILERAIKSVR